MRTFEFIVCLWVLALGGCTANAPSDGVCKKSCGSRPIGGGNLRAIPLSSDIKFSKCKVGSTLPTQTFRYFVYQDMTQSNSEAADNTSESEGVASATRLPAAGIAFTPQTQGYMEVTSESSTWCTDSCGVAEISFSPTCYEQDVQVGILVPGMLYEDNKVAAVKFTVSLE
jgi:hypothetical protein